MTISRWLSLIAVMVGFGGLRVAQHNALWLQGYAVGKQTQHLHAMESDVAWLKAQVTGLASPARLAEVAHERRLALVAWAPLILAASPHVPDSSMEYPAREAMARPQSEPVTLAADETLD